MVKTYKKWKQALSNPNCSKPAGAKSGDPMPTMADPGTQLGSIEDLGGPTPENYKSDDDSAKLKEPSLKTVADIVN